MEASFLIGSWEFWEVLIGHSGWGIIGSCFISTFDLWKGNHKDQSDNDNQKKFWPLMLLFVITQTFLLLYLLDFLDIQQGSKRQYTFYSTYLPIPDL